MMKRFVFLIGFLFLGGCCEEYDFSFYQTSECGNPCQELRPLYYPLSTLLQAYYGSAIGKALPLSDRAFAARAMQDILKYGAPGATTEWASPDQTAFGSIHVYEASPTGSVSREPIYCRAYEQEIYVGDDHLVATGKACADTFGIWRIVEEAPLME